MPDITGENRDENGRFIPGTSGNPFGRPRGVISIRGKIKEKLEEVPEGEKETYLELITKKILEKALKGEPQMIRLVWEQIDGRARQSVEISQSRAFNLASLFDRARELDKEKSKT